MSDIETETAITLRNRRDPHHADSISCRCLVTRPPMQRKPCWTVSHQIAMIDTALRGWTCPPIYIIARPDLTEHCGEGEDHVFDGAHKLEALFDFIDDKFAFKATGEKFTELTGKCFSEMPRDLQDRIKKYRFHINHVDSDTAESPDELRILWERVNKAGMKLNQFELDLPLIAPLIEGVLKPMSEPFYKTVLFPKEVSKRGELEQRLQVVLAISDFEEPRMQSQTAIVSRWHVEKLGATMAERTANIEKHGPRWRDVLARCHKMLMELHQLNLFCDAAGVPTVQEAHCKTELPFVLGRLARHFTTIEAFRSQKAAIAARLKADVFGKTIHEMSNILGGTGRNGTFQNKLLKYIEGIIGELKGIVQPRLFTKAQKVAKFKEQGGACAACKEPIHKHQLMDGDHVTAWSEGGATAMENLQILHRHCHQAKTAAAASV